MYISAIEQYEVIRLSIFEFVVITRVYRGFLIQSLEKSTP